MGVLLSSRALAAGYHGSGGGMVQAAEVGEGEGDGKAKKAEAKASGGGTAVATMVRGLRKYTWGLTTAIDLVIVLFYECCK